MVITGNDNLATSVGLRSSVGFSGSNPNRTIDYVSVPYTMTTIPTRAGTNITIANDGTISATGGGASYTAGDNIDITSDVISVPSVEFVETYSGDQQHMEYTLDGANGFNSYDKV